MRIDAHQHFWRYRSETHGWLEHLAADPRLRGGRHLAQDEPDERWLVRPDVVVGSDWPGIPGGNALRFYGVPGAPA